MCEKWSGNETMSGCVARLVFFCCCLACFFFVVVVAHGYAFALVPYRLNMFFFSSVHGLLVLFLFWDVSTNP